MPGAATSRHAAHKDWPICRRCMGTAELPAGSGRSRSCDPALDGCTGTGREGPPEGWVDPEYIDVPGVGSVLVHPGTDRELNDLVASGSLRTAEQYREELALALDHIDKKLKERDGERGKKRGLFGGRAPEA